MGRSPPRNPAGMMGDRAEDDYLLTIDGEVVEIIDFLNVLNIAALLFVFLFVCK